MAGRPPERGQRNIAVLVDAIRDLFAGRGNAGGEVTLTPNAATTAVAAINLGDESGVLLFPKTANASAEVGNGTIYVGTVVRGQFTITHANNAQANRTFFWVGLG